MQKRHIDFDEGFREESLRKNNYTALEYAEMVGVTAQHVRYLIRRGKIRAINQGRQRVIPREEVYRLLGHPESQVGMIRYSGRKYPHSYYLMYLVLESNCNHNLVFEQCSRFSLVHPEIDELNRLYKSLIDTAPPYILRRLHGAKGVRGIHDIAKFGGVSKWMGTLGLGELFDSPVYPCLNILQDSSDTRMYIELLLTGCVPTEEICQIIKEFRDVEITPEQLTFFRKYFYNLYQFNINDIIVYVNMLTNSYEAQAKSMVWGNPTLAKNKVGVVERFESNNCLHDLQLMSYMKVKEFFASGSHDDIQLAHNLIADIVRIDKRIEERDKSDAEELLNAQLEASEDGSNNPEFENNSEVPRNYDDIINDIDIDDDDDIDEESQKVG